MNKMRSYIVTVEFVGLTGPYRSRIEIRAKNTKSAQTKARACFGNRDGFVISVIEAVDFSTSPPRPALPTFSRF